MHYLRPFSHLYYETETRNYPLTETIFKRLSHTTAIEVPHYKMVFNRPNQHPDQQRKSRNLILARKHDTFLHPASYFIQNFGCEYIFYVPLVFNCVYDCSYCYLQGMYPSANIVVFVNSDDYFHAIDQELSNPRYTPQTPLYLCISYDTDLLAMEKQLGLVEAWVHYAQKKPHLLIESRTKSVNFRALSHLSPPPNVILSWTLLPQALIDETEHGTPSLEARLRAIKEAQEAGWNVRISIEPVIWREDYEAFYGAFLKTLFEHIDGALVRDLNVDLFRINGNFLKRLRTHRREPVLFFPYAKYGSIVSYDEARAKRLLSFFKQALTHYLPESKCYIPNDYHPEA